MTECETVCMAAEFQNETCADADDVIVPVRRDDEHALILQYCQTLGGEGSPCSQPQSPAQILQAVEREERGELERVIARLEEEQRYGVQSRILRFACFSRSLLFVRSPQTGRRQTRARGFLARLSGEAAFARRQQ